MKKKSVKSGGRENIKKTTTEQRGTRGKGKKKRERKRRTNKEKREKRKNINTEKENHTTT